MATETTPTVREESAHSHPPLRRGSRLWAISAVFITAMVVFGGLAFVLIDTPRAMVRAASDVFGRGVDTVNAAVTPTVTVRQAIRSAIGDVQGQARLVVMTADVHVDIERSSEKRVLWDYLQLGTTSVRVRVPDNRVQYVIPLEHFGEDDVLYDAAAGTLTVRVPSPVIDEQVVDVQSDRTLWLEETAVGWGRFESYSGEHLRDQVYQSLRDEVIEEGRHPLLLEKAKAHAEQAVRSLFQPHLKAATDVPIAVEFT